jgi:uncharacterized protein
MLADWEARFEQFIGPANGAAADPAHDLEHVRRVVANARRLAELEGGELAVVLPAAWLHDCVVLPKNSPDNARSSRLAAEKAAGFLQEQDYPAEHIPPIRHAIEAHSFSAGIPAQTVEARVVQDADRLDSLGAVGIARTLMLGAVMGKRLYDPAEPLPQTRPPDEGRNSIDHFYTKLLKLEDRMQTAAGRAEARRRTRLLSNFLAELERELSTDAW